MFCKRTDLLRNTRFFGDHGGREEDTITCGRCGGEERTSFPRIPAPISSTPSLYQTRAIETEKKKGKKAMGKLRGQKCVTPTFCRD